MVQYGVSLDAWIASHTVIKNLIFNGSNLPTVNIYDASDVLLAEISLDENTSEIDENGNLILRVYMPEASAPASGTASYANIITAAGELIITLPCMVSSNLIYGYCTMSSLTVTIDEAISINTLIIPAGPTI